MLKILVATINRYVPKPVFVCCYFIVVGAPQFPFAFRFACQTSIRLVELFFPSSRFYFALTLLDMARIVVYDFAFLGVDRCTMGFTSRYYRHWDSLCASPININQCGATTDNLSLPATRQHAPMFLTFFYDKFLSLITLSAYRNEHSTWRHSTMGKLFDF